MAGDGFKQLSGDEIDGLVKSWDKGAKRSWSGWIFARTMRAFGYDKPHQASIESWRGELEFCRHCGLDDAQWARFDAVDRAATRAGHRHRDNVVLLHLLAASAVFFAVSGAVALFGSVWPWAVLELAVLCAIVFLVRKERSKSGSSVPVHRAWLELRREAEAFRVKAMLYAFGVDYARDIPELAGKHQSLELESRETPVALDRNAQRKTIASLLRDQIDYHDENERRWKAVRRGLERAIRWIFYLVLVAVVLHLVPLAMHGLEQLGRIRLDGVHGLLDFLHSPKWLLLTAAGPAFAAGLHGIAVKLEIQRLERSSHAMAKRLRGFRQALEGDPDMETKPLALAIARAMYAEHDAWFNLMGINDIQMPA